MSSSRAMTTSWLSGQTRRKVNWSDSSPAVARHFCAVDQAHQVEVRHRRAQRHRHRDQDNRSSHLNLLPSVFAIRGAPLLPSQSREDYLTTEGHARGISVA